jgi:hypothetical protein
LAFPCNLRSARGDRRRCSCTTASPNFCLTFEPDSGPPNSPVRPLRQPSLRARQSTQVRSTVAKDGRSLLSLANTCTPSWSVPKPNITALGLRRAERQRHHHLLVVTYSSVQQQ